MKEYSICITTFSKREEMCCSLIQYISEHAPNIDIIVAINGDNELKMDEGYRSRFLSFCSKIPRCYPIVCPEFKSLAKIWNTLVIFSNTNYNLICNDDIEIVNPTCFKNIKDVINQTSHELFTINGGWSHYMITKQLLHELGYFDERLIAFGEEDGDMVYRFIKKYKKKVPVYKVEGFRNVCAYDKSDTKIDVHVDNKPRFNREFINLKYKYDDNGIYGMSPIPVIQVLDDFSQYPYEIFNIKNKHNIKKFKSVTIEYEN